MKEELNLYHDGKLGSLEIETNKQITLRPHHVEMFAEYYLNNRFYRDMIAQKYSNEFANRIKQLWDYLAFSQTDAKVTILSGLDTVCDGCPIRKEYCQEQDNLSIWNGAGITMDVTGLKIGKTYPFDKFLERVRRIYPYKTPITQ